MQVVAWPGYENEIANDELTTDQHKVASHVPFRGQVPPICPANSVCIPAYDCPPQSIYYTVDVPSPARGKVRVYDYGHKGTTDVYESLPILTYILQGMSSC